jgi:hypothetical protein
MTPEVATHYYVPGRRPFLNLSDLEQPELDAVLGELIELRKEGRHHRRFGPKYVAWRRLTEVRLRELFVARGGQPERAAPHYFVLGESTWFRGLAPGMLAVSVPLDALPAQHTSFTLVDSFGAMGFGPQFGFGAAAEEHVQQVYRLDELSAVVALHGLPRDEEVSDYDGYERRPVNQFIEIQLWADEPIRHLLG